MIHRVIRYVIRDSHGLFWRGSAPGSLRNTWVHHISQATIYRREGTAEFTWQSLPPDTFVEEIDVQYHYGVERPKPAHDPLEGV